MKLTTRELHALNEALQGMRGRFLEKDKEEKLRIIDGLLKKIAVEINRKE